MQKFAQLAKFGRFWSHCPTEKSKELFLSLSLHSTADSFEVCQNWTCARGRGIVRERERKREKERKKERRKKEKERKKNVA